MCADAGCDLWVGERVALPMDELAARDAVTVRALESADGAREIWSDADRVWAGRAAAEAVGESASDDAFIGRRAALALERLRKRHPGFVALTRSIPQRRSIVWVTIAIAFAVGALGVDIGPAHRINLLAPPLLALFAWNIVVYVALLASVIASRRGKASQWGGPLRHPVARLFRNGSMFRRKPAIPPPLLSAYGRFATEWSTLAAPLVAQRAAALLHLGAAALAAGAIAGLYVRGIALEYRAGWQSTFLTADNVANILHVVLAPGAWLTGIAIPDAAHLQTIGGDSAGENAARWIHLYAATLAAVVIVPRLALALAAWLSQRSLAKSMPLSLRDPYFQGLLRSWRRGTARIAAVTYSYAIPAANAQGLAQIATRALQSSVAIDWLPTVAYGADDVPHIESVSHTCIMAIFNLGATPERETHGAFVRALAAADPTLPLIAIVDTSEFVARFSDQPRRIGERTDSWQRMLDGVDFEPLFIALAHPDVARDGAALALRFTDSTS
jgi:hypothetical protein